MAAILGIGGLCIDRLAVIPRMPGWDEVEYISHYAMQQGGMVATAMAAAARLGEQVEFIGGIGNDEAGRYGLDVFQRENIAAHRIKIFDNDSTAFSYVLVHQESGKRTIIHYRGVQERTALNIPAIDLSGVQFLHLDGYWFDTALHTAKQAKKQGITISLDPSSTLLRHPRTEELFHYVDYLIPGYGFATQFTQETEPFRAARMFLKYGVQAVILTRGEAGSVVCTPHEQFHLPAFQVPVVDTTGAGDTFHGAFVAGLRKGYDLRDAVRFASAAAALKCTKLGGQAGIPTFEETMTFLQTDKIH